MEINHQYNTRSKVDLGEYPKINLDKIPTNTNTNVILSGKNTLPVKTIDLRESIIKNKKLESDATNLLKTLLLEKTLEFMVLEEEEDEDYEPIEGLPDEVIYMKEEKNYIKSLTSNQQKEIFKLEQEILDYSKTDLPHRFKILKSSLNIGTKSIIIKKLDSFLSMEESDNEYSKLSQWAEGINNIPFDCYSEATVSLNNTSNEIVDYLLQIKTILDKSIYGHIEAKEQILQEITNNITNPKALGNCIAIQGPPGNGKTTLVKDGICKALKRPFAFIALGGMQNSEFLLGHDYTYEGSRPGRIVEILQECKTMDPVIYFDELDKLSDTAKGEEIANLLCHLTDPSQNMSFHDKYYSGIDFNLSKATFIFSYNDESKISPILLDRMIRIKTKGFTNNDKESITLDYLLPSIYNIINFNSTDIGFSKQIIQYIIETYTEKEKGVRNLKRALTTIISKINILKLLHNCDSSTLSDKITLDINEQSSTNEQSQENNNKLVSFSIKNFKLPLELNREIVDNLLKKTTEDLSKMMMYT